LRLRSAFVGKDDSLTGIPESPKYYAVLWACKEAASKAIGLGMLLDFKELSVTGDWNRKFCVFENGKEMIHGNYGFFRDLVVAIGHGTYVILDCTDQS